MTKYNRQLVDVVYFQTDSVTVHAAIQSSVSIGLMSKATLTQTADTLSTADRTLREASQLLAQVKAHGQIA